MLKTLSTSLIFALALVLAGPSLAAPGGNGKGGGNSNGSEAGSNSGNGGGNGNAGNGNQSNGGNGNQGNGSSGKGQIETGVELGNKAASGLPLTNPDASEALQQVTRDDALPLSQLLEAVERVSTGRVLEIEMVSFRASPAYRVTLLEPSGLVRRVLFEARTGKPIGVAR